MMALDLRGIGVDGGDAISLDRRYMCSAAVLLLGVVAVDLVEQGGVSAMDSSEVV
jgi:hypothetical protein